MDSLLLIAFAVLPLLLAACGPAEGNRGAGLDEVAWRDEIAQYRQARIDRLKQPDSWLTLAGLFWLDEGTHTLGSGDGSDLVFPASAPERIGTLTVLDGQVRFEAAPGVEILHDGQPVETIAMISDAEGAPTILEYGALNWQVIDRDGELAIRLKDNGSLVRTQFVGIDTYDPDPRWRLEASFDRYDPPKMLPIPNANGTLSDTPAPGALVVEIDGRTYRLDVTGRPDDAQYFLVFGDTTNGRETYGGGRFLYVDAPQGDEPVVVDFNKAYNPPCVFTPYATCPLPPPQNKLPIRIEAGEKNFEGAAH